MKIQIIACLCIGIALAFPADEESGTLPDVSNLDGSSKAQPSTTIEEKTNDGAKETLESAASAWGHGYGKGWRSYGWGRRSYGYGGFYGGIYRYPSYGYGYQKYYW
ncbi:uncharacterized protein LOC129571867 isoform X2 [Sitodiplosis mosellana]|uniref:uncharacterized protein LOC129571867 isoform X2 n=1 Tax=Sitodiplosis mosellana TaxID=263140 RepID=UPI0024452CF3|nr:uncharacterized protein LOC129571867 isoform X2 [Sitodiplosis mosellana]